MCDTFGQHAQCQAYSGELSRMKFEPEREFETLLPEQQILISGAIDVIRLDVPPCLRLLYRR